MHVDFSNMARELGTRPDALRIIFRIQTRLQRLIRATATFEDAVALAGEFREPDSFSRSCGPKFEPQEKEEYLARRAELFPAYLKRFDTIESFENFGVHEGVLITANNEGSLASDKLYELVTREIEKATKLKEHALERLVEIQSVLQRFKQRYRDSDGVRCAFSVEQSTEELMRVIKATFFLEFQSAKNIPDMIAVFKKFGATVTVNDLKERRHNRNDKHAWSVLWEGARTMEDIFLIEKEVPEDFLSEKGVEQILAAITRDTILNKDKTFEAALARAEQLAGRDGYRASMAYSIALEATVDRVSSKKHVRQLIAIWNGRDKKSVTRSHEDRYPSLPKKIVKKWDELFLEEAQNETDLAKLGKLRDESPSESETYSSVSKKLNVHFDALLAQAQTEKDVDRVEEAAKNISEHLYIQTYKRKEEIRAETRTNRINALWEAVSRGEPIEDEKKMLIGLFHEFKEREPKRSLEVLLKLTKHFPAESVDEVPTEMMQ